MNGQLRQIEAQIANREFKKAEIAIARLLRADRAASELETLRILRSRIRLLTGRPDDALEDVITAQRHNNLKNRSAILELFGDIYFARFERASVGFSDRNDTEQAKQAYNQLIEEFPDYDNLGWVYYQIGRIALTENNISYAKELFQKALLNPSRIRALTAYCYERLGYIAYYEDRNSIMARDFLDRAVDTYPRSESLTWLVQVQLLLSRVYKVIGDNDAAIRAAELALSLAATSGSNDKRLYSEALLNIGEILSELENRDSETIAYLQEFTQIGKRPLGIDVTWSRVNEMLGNAHFNLGNYDLASSAYSEALQLNPDHPWEFSLYHRIARCQYHKHSYQVVVEIIEDLLHRTQFEGQSTRDYRLYDLLGNAQFALQNYGQAAIAYETALQLAPSNLDYKNQIRSYLDIAKDMIR